MYSKINHQRPIMLPQIFHVRVIKDLLSKHSFHSQTQFNTVRTIKVTNQQVHIYLDFSVMTMK